MDIGPHKQAESVAADSVKGSVTPDDLLIQSRNRHFGGQEIENRWWMGGNPYGTAMYNALSISFPKGEAFFIESARKFQDGAPEKLRREIRAFIQQEVVHSREHLCFNRHIEAANYDTSRMEQSVTDVMERLKDMPDIEHLAGTICLEHMTAVLAAEMIRNPAHFKDADEEQRKLWLWHASEEIEHKGVTYDTWLHATRDWTRWQRWKLKSKFMARISYGFLKNRTKGAMDFLQQDGITGPRAWFGFAYYALVAPGPIGRTIWPMLKFFLPGFHPWNVDDRYLIPRAESEYEAAIMDPPEDTVTEIGERRQHVRLKKVA